MKNEQYVVESSSSLLKFEFHSEGPKGRIRKQIVFRAFEDAPTVFNLGFGDVDENDEINDTVVTDNRDSQKVLTTVALAVLRFYEKYSGNFVYVTGSTKSRTRMYRMGIAKNIDEISANFVIYGYVYDSWEEFRQNTDYQAFLIEKKN